jgi:hypothetical protein
VGWYNNSGDDDDDGDCAWWLCEEDEEVGGRRGRERRNKATGLTCCANATCHKPAVVYLQHIMPLYLGFVSLPLLSPSSSSSQPTNLINQQTSTSKQQTANIKHHKPWLAGNVNSFPMRLMRKTQSLNWHSILLQIWWRRHSSVDVFACMSLPDSITLTETHY